MNHKEAFVIIKIMDRIWDREAWNKLYDNKDVIRAFSCGGEVEYRYVTNKCSSPHQAPPPPGAGSGNWINGHDYVTFSMPDMEYRIKPNPRCRIAMLRGEPVLVFDEDICSNKHFERWVGPWQEYKD